MKSESEKLRNIRNVTSIHDDQRKSRRRRARDRPSHGREAKKTLDQRNRTRRELTRGQRDKKLISAAESRRSPLTVEVELKMLIHH